MPPDRGNTVAVIPCLDEADAIGDVVRRLAPFVRETLVVDDGSVDDTSRAAAGAGAQVLRHERPLGKGAALATGWNAAATNPHTAWILLLDGDGQHAPEDSPALFAAAARDQADLVIGNRMPQAHAMPWLRRQTNLWMSRRISRLAAVHIPDSQCGFRLVRLHALQRVPLRSRHFEIESEMAVAFARAGLRIASAPVSVRYAAERSKIAPLRDTLRWLQWYRDAR